MISTIGVIVVDLDLLFSIIGWQRQKKISKKEKLKVRKLKELPPYVYNAENALKNVLNKLISPLAWKMPMLYLRKEKAYQKYLNKFTGP
jgi:hypothetical protein